VIFCKEIAKNLQRETTSAREFHETCRSPCLLQVNSGKIAEGADFCKKIPKNMQKTNSSACKSSIPAKIPRKLADALDFCKEADTAGFARPE
jgi:hypothetical protein